MEILLCGSLCLLCGSLRNNFVTRSSTEVSQSYTEEFLKALSGILWKFFSVALCAFSVVLCEIIFTRSYIKVSQSYTEVFLKALSGVPLKIFSVALCVFSVVLCVIILYTEFHRSFTDLNKEIITLKHISFNSIF